MPASGEQQHLGEESASRLRGPVAPSAFMVAMERWRSVT